MNSPQLIFRKCAPEDIDRLLGLQEDAFASLDDHSLLRRNSREMLLECLSPPHYTVGAFDSGILAAVGILYLGGRSGENLARMMDVPDELLGGCGNVKLIIVRSDCRGKGLGRRLITMLEDEAARLGIHMLCATVSPRNLPSLSNFEKLGYKTYGLFEKYGGLERLLLYKKITDCEENIMSEFDRNRTPDYIAVFERLPKTLDELKALPEASLDSPYKTAALTVAALCLWPENRDEAWEMLRYISGPREMTPYERQFINDRFTDGKDYIPRSYFDGAVPENDYTPGMPYTLRLFDDVYSHADERYSSVLLVSGGADTPRNITLRAKPSEGKWYLWEQFILVGTREPVSSDPWA